MPHPDANLFPPPTPGLPHSPARRAAGALRRGAHELAQWWRTLFFGAQVLVIALTPASYRKGARSPLIRHLYLETWRTLPGFTLLSALLSLVLIRIVVVTAQSYGLTQFALEMVVRVLVLELLPLLAAFFVGLRSTLVVGGDLARQHRQGSLGPDPLRNASVLCEVLAPRVLAGAFAVLAMVGVGGVLALLLAYLGMYGPSPWGLASFNRTVGHIFSLPVAVALVTKTLLFGLSVAVIPMASVLLEADHPRAVGAVPRGAVRLLLALVLIEGLFLAVKYI